MGKLRRNLGTDDLFNALAGKNQKPPIDEMMKIINNKYCHWANSPSFRPRVGWFRYKLWILRQHKWSPLEYNMAAWKAWYVH